MRTADFLYQATMAIARPLLRLAAPAHPRLRRAVSGWDGAEARLIAWAGRARDPARPLIWLHAPSVGEALMAGAILEELRERRPDTQAVFTHFSPSAERVAAGVGADMHAYLPWDSPRVMERVLPALRPDVVAFVRTEVWPVLAREAWRQNARVALVNAALAPGSSRLRALPRRILAPVYARLDAVGAVHEEDAARFSRFGVPADRVHVTRDARFDQVWRKARKKSEEFPEDPSGESPDLTVVAGSTWPADEARIIPAFAGLTRNTRARLLIAPHEPTARHLKGLERRLRRAGLKHARLGRLERMADAAAPEVVVVDRVGVLAGLYAAADVAYVGGGFGGDGLHSVIEPAAHGVPVLHGPRCGSAREAVRLAMAGGAWVVRDDGDLTERLALLSSDVGRRRRAGEAACDFVRASLGGAGNNAGLLAAWIPASGLPAERDLGATWG